MFKNLSASAVGISGHQSEIIELALTYGFRGIDVDIAEMNTRAKAKGMPYARRLIDSARMQVARFRLPVDLDTDDDRFRKMLEKLAEYGAAAAELGSPCCIVHVAPAGDRRPYHDNFEFHRRRLAELSAALQPSGIRLAVAFNGAETARQGKQFQFIHDLDAMMLLINMVGAPNVGLLLDLWDHHLSGGTVEMVSKLSGEQVVAVQVSNVSADLNPSDAKPQHRLMPGHSNGAIDVSAYLAAIKEIGFKGSVTPVVAKSGGGTQRREAFVKEAGESLDSVWRAAGLPAESRFSVVAPQS